VRELNILGKISKSMEGLRGLTWNSEGFKDPGTHLSVKEAIRDYSLDFIALLETGRYNFTVPFLDILRRVSISLGFVCHPMDDHEEY
jgi:hypothetical protein